MKNIYLLSALVLVTTIAMSQQWLENLPQDKVQNGELTFYEIQEAFNDYWEPYNVKNGYYEVNGEQVKAPYWKLFRRWEWYWADRVEPQTGEFPKTTAAEEFEKYVKQLGGNKSTSGNWTNLGTSSSSGGYHGIGRLNCIAFRPGSSSIFYVGSPSGGLWKTADGGSTWTVLTDNNAVLGVSDIVVIPTVFQDVLYIATGDKNGGSGWSMGGGQYNDNNSIGVLKSNDGGATWNTTGLSWSASLKRTISRLILDPNSFNQTLYAATSVGIYKTTDAGVNWTLQQGGSFIDMEMNPSNSSILYASTKDYWGNPLIYYTTNGGTNWYVSKTFASTDYRVDLAVTAANNAYVYAIVANRNGGLTSIEQSVNSGVSFSSVYTAGASGTWLLGYYCDGSGTSNSGQGGYDLCIAADPTSASTVYIGGVNTWKSTTSGVSWSINNMWTSSGTFNWCGAPEVHADQHFLAFQNGTSTLFECNDGGVYKTTDGGTNWTDLTNGMAISQIYRLGVSQTSSSEVINGLQDNGTKTYSSGSWSDVLGGDGMECFIDYTNYNTQYGTLYFGDLKRTTNHWGSYSTITSGLSGSGAWVTPFTIDPNVNTTIYVGYQDVFKSINQGTSWTKISTWAGDELKSIVVAPSNSNYICAATSSTSTTTSKIYRTTTGGSPWTNITGTLPTASADITYVSVHATNPSIIWVTMGGYNTLGVYESINGGSTWTNISAGLPALPVMCVVQNKLNTGQTELYAGTDVGVYVKSGTANWTSFMTGLPNVFVPELEIYYDNTTPANSRLRAATFGRGLWESDLLTSTATWNGIASPVWNLAANWTPTVVPSGSSDVIIPSSSPNWPTFTGNFALGSDCKDLTMNGSSELTFAGDLTIPANFTLTNNASSKLLVSGNWNNTGGTFVPGTGTVEFNGGVNASLNSGVSNSGNLTTSFASGFGQMANYFDIVASGGKSISINSFDINCNFYGPVSVEVWYLPSTYVGNQSNPGAWVQLGATQTVTGQGIGNATPVNPGASIVISSGSTYGFYISCYVGGTDYIVFTGGNSISSNTDITINCGEYGWTQTPGNGGGAGYSFNGTVYYTYTSIFPLLYWDLDVAKSNVSLTANNNVTVSNDFTIKPGGWFTNSTGNTLNVGNNFKVEPSGSFIDNGTTSVAGASTVQLLLTEEMWHFVSPPINDALLGVFHLPAGNSDIWVKYWDEVNGQWVTISNVGLSLNAMQGYSVWVDNNVVQNEIIDFTGTLNNNITTAYPVTSTSTNTDNGWNHIGNPYPSALDWDAVSGWTKTNVDNTVYYWNPASGTGNYSYYVGSGTAPYTGGTSANNGTQFIPAMQGFIVHCNTSAGGSIKIENDARVHDPQAFYKDTQELSDFLKLKASGNNFSDEIVIRFFEGAGEFFDSDFDAYKLYGQEEAPQLYSLASEDKLSINSFPELEDYKMVSLGFECEVSGQFSIEASELASFENSVTIYLEDLKENILHNLSETNSYTFSHQAGNDPSRFIVHFGAPSGINIVTDQQVYVFSHEDLIIIQNPKLVNGYVKIFDLLGQNIYNQPLQPEETISISIGANPGYYLVKITSGKNTQTAKVLLK